MIELIEDDAPSPSETAASPNGPSWRGPLSLALLAGLAVLAWSLTRPPTEPGPDQVVIEEGVGDTPATTLIVPTSQPLVNPPTTQLPAVQIVGEPTGLWLFFGGDANLQRLDVDTGVVDLFGLRAHPLLAVGNELVVGHNATNSVGWVSLSDPGEQPNGWKDARVARGVLPGHMWTFERATWTQFDLADNKVIEQIQASAPVPLGAGGEGRPALLIPGPRLISTGNGVFEATDDGDHIKVADGRLLTFDDSKALVEQCPASLSECRPVWLDRERWQPLDLAVPESGVAFAEILGGGRYLHTVDIAGERHQLLFLEPGQAQEVGAGFRLSTDVGSLTISADGRWMALGPDDSGLVQLLDMNTGDVAASWPGFDAEFTGTLLLVDQSR